MATTKKETKTTAKKAPVKKATATAKSTTTKKPSTKKATVKKTKKETTVVMTIEATFILKAGQTPGSINISDICPTADNVNLKKMQVFDKDE